MRKTWGEFKAEVEAQGVTDETEIAWIDIGAWAPVYVTLVDGVAEIS